MFSFYVKFGPGINSVSSAQAQKVKEKEFICRQTFGVLHHSVLQLCYAVQLCNVVIELKMEELSQISLIFRGSSVKFKKS